MMKSLTTIFFMSVALAGCSPFGELDQVYVEGRAKVEVPPDGFRMVAYVRARGGTATEALSKATDVQQKITETLPSLEGLEALSVKTQFSETEPLYSEECEPNLRPNQREHCEFIGSYVELAMSIKGAPAESAGNAISLTLELGAADVQFRQYYVENAGKHAIDAERAALENAYTQARRLAEAMDSEVTGLHKLQNKEVYENWMLEDFFEEKLIAVGAGRNLPETILQLTPQPIEIERQIQASFKIRPQTK